MRTQPQQSCIQELTWKEKIKMRKEQKEDLRNVMKVMSNAHKTGKHYFVFYRGRVQIFYFICTNIILETKSKKLSTLLEKPNIIVYKTSVYKD